MFYLIFFSKLFIYYDVLSPISYNQLFEPSEEEDIEEDNDDSENDERVENSLLAYNKNFRNE